MSLHSLSSFPLAFLLGCIVAIGGTGCQPPSAAPVPQGPAAGAGLKTAPSSTPPTSKVAATDQRAPKHSERAGVAKETAGRPDGTAPVQEPILQLTEQELKEGWIALFDGQSLFGWQANSDANWRVEEGAIVVDAGSPGLLCTTTQFANYVLRCEFRAPPETNSGIFLHTPLQPKDPARDCYELNIAPPDNPFPTGSLVKREKASGDFARDEWQSYEITLQGGTVKIALNGEEVLDYTDPEPLRRGHIGLQLNQGQVAFRNIKLRPLGVTPLFNGSSLEGWNEYPEMASKFTVTPEGWIHVKDGRGQLETKKEFGDFALQLECISHAKNLNSGVFFRCIPGEQMNGYECQIHNGTKDGNRSQPLDCGTGGIFRRQNARYVVADDLEWFHLTLIAERNHMAAWVNGFQVSDWTDDRSPHANPRSGRRDEPGTLMLQGHDPTTDLSFRALQIAEIPPRVEPK